MLLVNEVNQIYLGIQGENEARTIQIDVSAWAAVNQNASFSIWHKRNGDTVPSATGASYDPESGIMTWVPTSTDTYVSGEGVAEVRLTKNGIIKKSKAIKTAVSPAVTGAGTTLGSDWQSYIDAITRAAGVAIIKDGMIRLAINDDGHLIFSYTDEVPVEPAEEEEEADDE